MSKLTLDGASIGIDDLGRVVLRDSDLDALCDNPVYVVAGGDGPGGAGSTNAPQCTNANGCDGSYNKSCLNTASCAGATNNSCPPRETTPDS